MSDDRRRLFERDLRAVATHRGVAASVLENAAAAPVEAQVAFIKELLKTPDEAAKFQVDPKLYAVQHGMLLDPEVVKFVANAILFDTVVDPDFSNKLGDHTLKDVVDLRERFGGRPFPPTANVVAAAAVVAAVAAVVTMVVTLVRTKRPQDRLSLYGQGPGGVLLPGRVEFRARDTIIRSKDLRPNLPNFDQR